MTNKPQKTATLATFALVNFLTLSKIYKTCGINIVEDNAKFEFKGENTTDRTNSFTMPEKLNRSLSNNFIKKYSENGRYAPYINGYNEKGFKDSKALNETSSIAGNSANIENLRDKNFTSLKKPTYLRKYKENINNFWRRGAEIKPNTAE